MIRISGLDVLVITILGIIQLCNTHILPRRSQACAAAPADILFLLDSSRSEGFYNFELQKNFVSKFVTFLNIGPNDAQVSVGTFSTHANSFFLLNSYHNQYSLLNAIARIPYLPGGTHTDYALYMAEHYTFTPKNGDRLTAPNIVYVLTDGESDSQYHTHIAAQHLKGTGAKVFAIGVGHVSMNELIAMATDHEHVFTVNSFTDLESIQHLVQATYCDVISGTLCIDKISSCYTYSKSVCLEPSFVAWAQMNCPDYCGFCQINTPIPPTIQIPTIPSAKSTTVLPATKATPLPSTTIKLTTSTIKTSTTKGPCVDKITNCAAYGDSVCTTYRLWSIENCARFCVFCHDKNMTPTTQTSVKTTNAATSTSQRVYDVCEDKLAKCSTYGIDICVKYASWAAVQCPKFCRFCTHTVTTPPSASLDTVTTPPSATQKPSCAKTPADILFVLDASTSIKITNFEKERNFVAGFVNDLDIGPNDVQVSVGTFSDNARGYFYLHTHQNKTDLLNAIRNIPYEYGQTHTHLAFQLAEQYIFTNFSGDRPSATNIVFVLTDGQSQNHTATFLGAQKLKDAGVKIYAIGIGGHVQKSELQDIASDSGHVFMVDSFADLPSIHNLVQRTYCEGYSSTVKTPVTVSSSTTQKSTSSSPAKSTTSITSKSASETMTKSTITASPTITTQSVGTTAPISTTPTSQTTVVTASSAITPTTQTTVATASSATTSPTPTSTVTTKSTTASSTTIATPPPIPSGPCVDKIGNCAGYGDGVCLTYRKWSVMNCARFCLFCHGSDNTGTTQTTTPPPTPPLTTRNYTVCEDKVPTCINYGPEICFKYTSWAAVQCPKFCVFCKATDTTTTTSTTTTTTTTMPSPTSPRICADTENNNCSTAGPIICFENQVYAENNCPVFCNFCTPPVITLGVTALPAFQSSTTSKPMTTNPDVIVIGKKRHDKLYRRLSGYRKSVRN
ncbi:mucin-5AC-like [Saccostrea echinata]|uniref:mucin-5AC-like n=1 Tax=Saccostrea echinata TaxID=191078 RepID=UPI002A82C479|nr:mucin-5AC-like [Saccostrea echinata]